MTEREQQFIRAAVDLARDGMNNGEGGPFGCVIVRGDEIVGRGWNRVIAGNDPTAHAEVVAIRDACARLGTFQLTDCELYTSCEPCPMCMGAIYWARPSKVYFASSRFDASHAGFDDSMIYEELNVPYNERKIRMIQIPDKEADSLWKVWKEKGDKIEY
ncbi:MAG: nucleoside deaminase [Chitinophagaceae bacterium]